MIGINEAGCWRGGDDTKFGSEMRCVGAATRRYQSVLIYAIGRGEDFFSCLEIFCDKKMILLYYFWYRIHVVLYAICIR